MEFNIIFEKMIEQCERAVRSPGHCTCFCWRNNYPALRRRILQLRNDFVASECDDRALQEDLQDQRVRSEEVDVLILQSEAEVADRKKATQAEFARVEQQLAGFNDDKGRAALARQQQQMIDELQRNHDSYAGSLHTELQRMQLPLDEMVGEQQLRQKSLHKRMQALRAEMHT